MSSIVDTIMTAAKLEEVASEFIEIEVDTSEFTLLEPLRDHNYILRPPEDTQKPGKVKNTENIIKLPNKCRRKTNQALIYNCELCGYTTKEKDVIVKHREVHEKILPGTKYMACVSCNLNSVPNDCHKCPECSFYTKKISSLKIHMHIHTKRMGYKCTDCRFAAKDLKELISHYKEHKKLQSKSISVDETDLKGKRRLL